MIETNTIYHGDCLQVMSGWPDACVDCCVTSPPYWGLRDYGTGKWEGGDPECDHIVGKARNDVSPERLAQRAAEYGTGQGTGSHVSPKYAKDTCPKCGATRIDHQIGMEESPAEYIAKMVAVFEQVRRVLKDEGTLWLNVGDSYAAGTNTARSNRRDKAECNYVRAGIADGLKPKDLCMIPARLAIALQDAGWYLRSEIIWHKPNPMPESVKDRPTSSHEKIYLLAKSQRYWYDADAIAEPLEASSIKRNQSGWNGNTDKGYVSGPQNHMHKYLGSDAAKSATTANARNVWTIPTKPYAAAHFAVFPPELPRRCILAGCPPGGVVLDPFFGSGTTGMVAEQLGRQWVGIELNPEYITLARKRTQQRGIFIDV